MVGFLPSDCISGVRVYGGMTVEGVSRGVLGCLEMEDPGRTRRHGRCPVG